MLHLNPGEAYLTKYTEQRPIPCYFKNLILTTTDDVERINTGILRKVIDELGLNLTRKEDITAIIKAKKLIRNYQKELIQNLLRVFSEDMGSEKLVINGMLIALREKGKIKYRLPLKIYMRYHLI